MIVGCWDGFGVYRSEDLSNWKRQPENILRYPGMRPLDGSFGSHGDANNIDTPILMNTTAIQVA